jgi:predicted DNA-binding transcriptional regulator YafY
MRPAPGHTPLAMHFVPGQVVRFRYRNWKGVVSERTARVTTLVYGTTEWHPQPQWLMQAFDMEKKSERTFALHDMVPIE